MKPRIPGILFSALLSLSLSQMALANGEGGKEAKGGESVGQDLYDIRDKGTCLVVSL